MKKLLLDTGFSKPAWVQTLSNLLEEVREIEPVRAGRSQGAFVVIKASRELLVVGNTGTFPS